MDRHLHGQPCQSRHGMGKTEQNVEVITLSAEEKAKWDAKLAPLTEKWVVNAKSKGFAADAIVNDIKALIKK